MLGLWHSLGACVVCVFFLKLIQVVDRRELLGFVLLGSLPKDVSMSRENAEPALLLFLLCGFLHELPGVVCEMLIDEIVEALPKTHDMPKKEVEWIKDMLEYNVKGGKMNRGLIVVQAGVAILNKQGHKKISNEQYCQLAVLGWAIEWLQAWLLVADDIMDSSVTRRGQPCWYKKLEQIWYIAINDAFTIEAFVFQMLKRHFQGHPNYLQLVDLMCETSP